MMYGTELYGQPSNTAVLGGAPVVRGELKDSVIAEAGHVLLGQVAHFSFLASFNGMEELSERVMDGLILLKPDNAGVQLGFGVAKLAVGKVDESIAVFKDKLLIDDPDNMEALCFLGLAYNQQGKADEARTLLEIVVANGGEDIGSIARAYLEGLGC